MLSDFISLIFPQNCSGCNSLLIHSEKGICTSCFIELDRYSRKTSKVTFVFGRKEVADFITAFDLIKNSILQNIFHKIKYNNDSESANILGVELGKRLKKFNIKDKVDCIVPVPVSKKKLKLRKFNQSEEIAKGINQVLDISIESNWLLRRNNLKSQTFSNRFKRSQNVKEEYYINKKKTLIHKRLLILDDIVTTGSTIDSCLEAIKNENQFLICVASVALTKKD